jgi:hypothetical protein
LLLLAAVALLVVPFLPFLLLSRARRAGGGAAMRLCRQRQRRRHPRHVRLHDGLAAHLRAPDGQRALLPLHFRVRALSSEACAARYDAAVAVWQEASYSDHPMNRAQRDAVRSLMEELQALLYAKADRRTRLRLRLLEGYTG